MATLDRTLDLPLDGAGSTAPPRVRRWALPARISRTVLLGFVLLLLGALGVFQVLQTSQVATLGYELSALEFERTQLQAEIRQVKVAIANEGTRAAAEERALQGLDMLPADPAFRISVDEPAPTGPTVPRRFVETAAAGEVEAMRGSAWWERLLAQLLGAQ